MRVNLNLEEIREWAERFVDQKMTCREISEEIKDYIENNYILPDQENEVFSHFEKAIDRVIGFRKAKQDLIDALNGFKIRMEEHYDLVENSGFIGHLAKMYELVGKAEPK